MMQWICKNLINYLYKCFRLRRNQERNLSEEPEEQEEKIILSLACINFLKVSSMNITLRSFMVDNAALETLKKSMYYEDRYMKDYHIPIDIENSYIGRNIEYLFQCTTGKEGLYPYSIVAYRLVARLADILNGKTDPSIERFDGDNGITLIKAKAKGAFKRVLKKEIKNWKPYSREGKQSIYLKSDFK